MTTVLITGAAGFIGRHAARHFADSGMTVIGVGHGNWTPAQAGEWGIGEWHAGDIDGETLRRASAGKAAPQLILHLAGGASVGSAIAEPMQDFQRTVVATAALLDWARLEAPEARVVAVSSAAVYGAGLVGAIPEDRAGTPYSPYGFHKLMMEQLCRSHASNYGLRVAIVRLFSVYGAGLQKQLLWDLNRKLALGVSEILLDGTGDELRDWTDVRDVVRVFSLASKIADERAPAFNAGTGRATSVRDIAELVCAAWGKGRSLRFSGRGRAGDPFSLVADSSTLNALEFEWNIPVRQGIADYVSWFRAGAGDSA